MEDADVIQPQPRIDFGAPLEPPHSIYNGAGQDLETWKAYDRLLSPAGLAPDLFMAYCGVRGLKEEGLSKFADYWKLRPESPPILQLGLSMTHDGQPDKCYAHEVAAGRHDDSLHLLGEFLAREKRPALIRIGYECTGPWNGYEPESFIAAYRRAASILREHDFPLATVWCVEGGWTAPAADYYPGDEFVDWWSVDLFAVDHFEKSRAFMEASLKHKKPVLIGECTPRRVGVLDGKVSWNTWYKPFFEWIGGYPNVKGFSYINWEWSGFKQWEDWGDARLEQNEYVLEKWKRHLRALPLVQS